MMVTNKDKSVCIPEGSKADWKCNLRSFIDDTVIEFSPVEDETTVRYDRERPY
jgi:hypothetical protein